MNVLIAVGTRDVAFTMDQERRRWHCADKQEEAEFPLITFSDNKRYELYSDGTFAEVEM
jgi:hypothetical protein